jgi:hypothetical protein
MEKSQRENAKQPINRWLHIGFVMFGLYKLITVQYGDAAMYLGISLAFDPFDPSVTWKLRPTWQRVWLILLLAAAAAGFGMEVGTNDGVRQGFRAGWNSSRE